MKGVVFPGNRQLELLDFPDPVPGQGEVVLEIKASGMCGSDLKFYRPKDGAASLGLGNLSGPIIAGHEPCGVVVAIDPSHGANAPESGHNLTPETDIYVHRMGGGPFGNSPQRSGQTGLCQCHRADQA